MNQHFMGQKAKLLHNIIGAFLLCAIFLAACQAPATQVVEPVVESTFTTTPPTEMPAPTVTALPSLTETPAAIPETGKDVDSSLPGEATLNVANNLKYGKILVDGNGMTLYMYTEDEPNKSNCSGACLEAWPPLITQGEPVLGEGIDASLVDTALLEDGSMIVTYNKMPLYTWYRDTKPGDVTGQGNKDVWYVVSPDGKVVGLPETSENAADDYDEYEYDYSNNK